MPDSLPLIASLLSALLSIALIMAGVNGDARRHLKEERANHV